MNISPTDSEDGSQAQFVTLTEEENTVELVEVGTADSTYTVVADLSNQSTGDTGTVVVWVGSETRADANEEMSSQFKIGGNNTDDTNQDGESNGGGNAGETVEGNDTGGESDGTDSTDNSGGEGLPGFTAAVALSALSMTAVYHRSRDG